MNRSIIKKTALIISSLILTFQLHSQTNLIWNKHFGSSKYEYVLNEVIDESGNLYVAGKTTGIVDKVNFGKNDGFLTKIDSSGKVLWSRQFGSSEEEDIQWCTYEKSGNVYITGSTTGSLSGKNFGKEDLFVVKYDRDGKLLWRKQFGTDSLDIAKGIYADNKGGIYVTGATDGKFGKSAIGRKDGFILKLDSNGNVLFTVQFGTPMDDFSYSVSAGQGNDILVCGTTWGDLGGKNKGFIDGFTGSFTEKGELIKYNQFGSDGFDIAMISAMDKENNIYVGGSTSGSFGSQQEGEGDAYLLKLNQKGDVVWNSQFGTKNNDGVRAISFEAGNHNMLISGIVNLPPANGFIRMYNTDGELMWERIFTGASGKDVKYDNKGNFYHLGLTDNDFYVAKLRLTK